jgi:hypothetical protein
MAEIFLCVYMAPFVCNVARDTIAPLDLALPMAL